MNKVVERILNERPTLDEVKTAIKVLDHFALDYWVKRDQLINNTGAPTAIKICDARKQELEGASYILECKFEAAMKLINT